MPTILGWRRPGKIGNAYTDKKDSVMSLFCFIFFFSFPFSYVIFNLEVVVFDRFRFSDFQS